MRTQQRTGEGRVASHPDLPVGARYGAARSDTAWLTVALVALAALLPSAAGCSGPASNETSSGSGASTGGARSAPDSTSGYATTSPAGAPTPGGGDFVDDGPAFVSTTGSLSTTTGGFVDDCQPRTTTEDTGCRFSLLCDDNLTTASCGSEGNGLWGCSCNQPEWFSFELESLEGVEAACADLQAWCAEDGGPAASGGSAECTVDYLIAESNSCDAEFVCRVPATVNEMDVTLLISSGASCRSETEGQWQCFCDDAGEEFEIQTETPWDACADAATRCGEDEP